MFGIIEDVCDDDDDDDDDFLQFRGRYFSGPVLFIDWLPDV